MRLRKKKHLNERFDDSKKLLIETPLDNINPLIAEQTKTLLNYKEIFDNDNRVYLEIGCGKGDYAIGLAKMHPEINILAVEVVKDVLVNAMEKANETEVTNLRFLCLGAEYLLKFIPEKSIDRIILNFSTPFQKKSYKNRRLTSRRFLHIYEKILVDNGEIWQKTDDLDFFEFSLDEYREDGWTLFDLTYDLHKDFPSGEDNIITEYESRFLAQGKLINGVKVKK